MIRSTGKQVKVGDLVKNLNSESRMVGIVVGWSGHQSTDPRNPAPIVLWTDGRCNWVLPHRVEVISEAHI